MNVLFISRATLFTVRGGDTVQMEQTAAALERHGVAVTIALCNNRDIHYSNYQLIHFFNIIRPADILYHIRKSKLPFVVSPIYVEYTKQGDSLGLQQRLLGMLGKHFREYVKTVARALKNGERIMSPGYLLMGHGRSIKYILSRCRHLLPNSHSEYNRLKRDFSNAGVYSVIPNAIDNSVFGIRDEDWRYKRENSVLCIARIEPQKNQMRIIKALNNTKYNVVFVGDPAPNHQDYYKTCRAMAAGNISFISFVDQGKVADLCRQHKVHILASWFETTGLSSLEAIACGCNIVISRKGDTEEYFKGHAFYCEPGDTNSIREAVDQAMAAAVNKEFMNEIKEHYSWEVTARTTHHVYQKVTGA